MALVLFAWAVRLGSPLALLVAPLFVVVLTRVQIVPEERAMRALFAHEYAKYEGRVRRWL